MDLKSSNPHVEIGLVSYLASFVPGRDLARGVLAIKNIAKACVDLSTNTEHVHNQMFASASSHHRMYYRFNVERGMESIGLQDWKASVRIGELTKSYLEENEMRMKKDKCVEDLLNPTMPEGIYTLQYILMQIPNLRNWSPISMSPMTRTNCSLAGMTS